MKRWLISQLKLSLSLIMETKPLETYNLTIETGDEGAEIFILNSQFQRVASGVGKSVTFKLHEGLYTIKVAAGCESVEKSIALLSKHETVEFKPVELVSRLVNGGGM